MSIVLAVAMLVIGFAVLVLGAEGLVRGASSLAKKLRVNEITIGLTVVAFGTSMPELVVNVIASAKGSNAIAFGNVIGSNIFNILVILGISGLIFPLAVQKNTVWKEIPLALLAAVVLLVMVNDRWLDGAATQILGRGEALTLLAFFVLFVVYVFGIANVQSADTFEVTVYRMPATVLLILGGLAGLMLGGWLVVEHAVVIARAMHVSEKMIGLTIVAAGTSLPELATSAVAAYRRRVDIAVGNIVGSNIFNVLFILGISGVIRPATYDSSLNVDTLVMIGATLLLFITMFTGKTRRLDRWEAALMLACYGGYLGYLIYRR